MESNIGVSNAIILLNIWFKICGKKPILGVIFKDVGDIYLVYIL